jgi:hypothetical protein
MTEGTHILFIPAKGSNLGIAPSSAIIAAVDQCGPDRVLIHFEGNLYGAENLKTYESRIRQASGRQVERYPTTAKMAVAREQLVEVGRYDYANDRVLNLLNEHLLESWIPDESEWIAGFVPW